MNEKNCATLEASQRLVDARIVLETEAVWRCPQWGLGQKEPHSELIDKGLAADFRRAEIINNEAISFLYPAPSMAEVWRELPKVIIVNGRNCFLSLTTSAFSDICYCGYLALDEYWIKVKRFAGNSPTDALIDLLIWVRREESHESARD